MHVTRDFRQNYLCDFYLWTRNILAMIPTYFNVFCIYDVDFCCSWDFGNIVPDYAKCAAVAIFKEIFRENI